MSATQIGILYSVATGIILRTINPDAAMGDAHLDWLDQNKPAGTTLLRLNRSDIGADMLNCPNLDFLIPFISKNHGLNIGFGKNCAVVDVNNNVVDVVLCCPVLYQQKLQNDSATVNSGKPKGSLAPNVVANSVIQLSANIGDTYDPINNVIIPKIAISQPS